jgi:hypothetical protein
MKHLCRAIAFVTTMFLGASQASAQETCLLYQRGTVECPGYGAPAATAVPGPSKDAGIATIANGISTGLFSGTIPPNGFMVQVFPSANGTPVPYGNGGALCFVNDAGPSGFGSGFAMQIESSGAGTFSTPHGYKPIGLVSIWCRYLYQGAQPFVISITARAW